MYTHDYYEVTKKKEDEKSNNSSIGMVNIYSPTNDVNNICKKEQKVKTLLDLCLLMCYFIKLQPNFLIS